MTILIKNGILLDPKSNRMEKADIFLQDGWINEIGQQLQLDADRVIEAEGLWITPGLIDVHVHLREPGFEHKETIKTGTRAAAMGGFTTVCCMPNTNPVCDNRLITEYIKLKAEREGMVHVLPIGAVTKGQEGMELANIGQMAEAGICAISEDGKSVLSAGMLKKAMKYAKKFNLPVFSHCEDPSLVGAGVMNAGKQAEIMGLKGISNDSEEVIIARDILLAASAGAKLHICHMSTRGGVELLRDARRRGEAVTAEVTPHHFTLSEKAVDSYHSNTKMNPPLRSEEDVQALRKGLQDDTISIIATDHAPHSEEEKNCEYETAPFGIVGLETALPLCMTELVNSKLLTPLQCFAKLTCNPAELLGIDAGLLQVGKRADLTVIDPQTTYVIDSSKFASKGRNTPFHGRQVQGRALYTIVGGNIVMEQGIVAGGTL